MTGKNKKYQNKNGFTLIELLVVISIIGILSSIVLTSLDSGRKKAKIAVTKTMVDQLHEAILLNYQQSEGTSPAPANTDIGTGCTYWGPGTIVGIVNNTGNYYAYWLGPYLSAVPKDSWGHCYAIDGPVNEGCPADPNGAKLCSAGPNGVFESWNGLPESRGDDICKAFGCP